MGKADSYKAFTEISTFDERTQTITVNWLGVVEYVYTYDGWIEFLTRTDKRENIERMKLRKESHDAK